MHASFVLFIYISSEMRSCRWHARFRCINVDLMKRKSYKVRIYFLDKARTWEENIFHAKEKSFDDIYIPSQRAFRNTFLKASSFFKLKLLPWVFCGNWRQAAAFFCSTSVFPPILLTPTICVVIFFLEKKNPQALLQSREDKKYKTFLHPNEYTLSRCHEPCVRRCQLPRRLIDAYNSCLNRDTLREYPPKHESGSFREK